MQENLNFKQLYEVNKQFVQHKQVIEKLTGSIAADQLLVRLLQGLKSHVEEIENHPDAKYQYFRDKIEEVLDQKTLDHMRTVGKRITDRNMTADEWAEHRRRSYPEGPDDYERAPYT
jgi:hypothetical protein